MKPLQHIIFLIFLIAQICFTQLKVENVLIERDGIILQGRFYSAGGEDYQSTVLLLPGFPGGESDVLGIGEKLASAGFNTLTFNYAGTYKSQGMTSFENNQKDIDAAFAFLKKYENVEKYRIDIESIYLGGWCHGGGMALSYASKHPEITSVFSVAGNDFGEFLRFYQSNTEMKNIVDKMFDDLISKPEVARFEKGAIPFELVEAGLDKMDTIFDIRKNAAVLATKDILLIGGWDDTQTTIDQFLLPLYRALQKEKAKKVKIVAFQDGHYFKNTRNEVAETITTWIRKLNMKE